MDELREAHYEQVEEIADSGDAQGLLQTLKNIELSGPSEEVLAMITEALTEFVQAPKYCEYQTYAVTLETPAEYGCEEITVAGSDFCKNHD